MHEQHDGTQAGSATTDVTSGGRLEATATNTRLGERPGFASYHSSGTLARRYPSDLVADAPGMARQ